MKKTIEVLRALNRDTKAEVYIVGGFVRDLLRKKRNNDLDVVIRKASLKVIISYLKQHGKVKKVSLRKTTEKFGVSLLLFKANDSDVEVQISLARRGERQIADPNNTLSQDYIHRDFTINALYLPINFKSRKDIIDLSEGKADIKARTIKANGDPTERIKESPIRIMRALSLAARTGYRIDKTLSQAIVGNVSLLKNVPVEGIRIEFNKILLSKRPSKYLKLMQKLGILHFILPELDRAYNVKQDARYHKYDVFHHCVYTADHIEATVVLRLASIMHDIGKVDTRRVVSKRITFHKHEMVSVKLAKKALARLKYDNKTKSEVIALIQLHMYHYTREFTGAAVRRFIKKAGINSTNIDSLREFPLFKLRAAERLGNGLKNIPVTEKQKDFEERIRRVYRESNGLDIKDLAINGHDLMSLLNISPSPAVGEVLKHLLNDVLEHPDHNEKTFLLGKAVLYIKSGECSCE